MCRKNKILFGFFFGFYSIILTGQLYQSDSLERILRSDTISDSHKFDILQDLCWEYIASDHPKVTQYIGEMVVLNLKLNGSKKTYNVENLLGLYYKSRGTFDKAFYHFHEALKVTESEKIRRICFGHCSGWVICQILLITKSRDQNLIQNTF